MALRPLEVLPFKTNGQPIRGPSTDGVMARAAATAAEMIVVPTGAKYVRLASNSDFYARFGSTTGAASIPADTTDGTACELFPYVNGEHWRFISGVTGISVISPSTAASVITASFFTE
jgi:hypothetical protein